MTEPTLNRKSVTRVAKKLCELGATTEDLAEVFGVPKDETERWLRKNSDFSRACANGRIAAFNKISNILLKRATGMNITQERVVRIDGNAARIVVEETRAPDLEAAQAVVTEFRKCEEVKVHDTLRSFSTDEVMAALRSVPPTPR